MAGGLAGVVFNCFMRLYEVFSDATSTGIVVLSSFFVGPLEGAYTSSLNEQHVRHIMHQRPPIAVVGSFVTCNKLKHLPKGKIVYVNIYIYIIIIIISTHGMILLY